jgi:hypothetical protein
MATPEWNKIKQSPEYREARNEIAGLIDDKLATVLRQIEDLKMRVEKIERSTPRRLA